MASAAGEKTAEELRNEIAVLRHQQWQISERLRDPRGLRLVGNGPRNKRTGNRYDQEEPPLKRRLSSAVFKVKDGEVIQDKDKQDGSQELKAKDIKEGDVTTTTTENDKRSWNPPQQRGDSSRRDGNRRTARIGNSEFEGPAEHVPRVLPKVDDPNLVNRDRRILKRLVGTLEKFQKEDRRLSTSEAFMRRSSSLQRAEQRAREESERLRQQEREKIAENRRRDLALRARVIAKAEEKRLELLFLQWSEHHKRLTSSFLRTKAEPPIYYLPKKPLDEDAVVTEQRKEQAFLEWKTARRKELDEDQKKLREEIIANAETRWQNRNARRENNNAMNLQETMDKELETHQLEHGPKTRKILGGTGNNDEEDDVEDINVGEDDIIDDVLEGEDATRLDDVVKPEAGGGRPKNDSLREHEVQVLKDPRRMIVFCQ